MRRALPARLAPLLLAPLLVTAPATTFAGRPLTTEDASVLEDKRCQLEAWVDRTREASVAWLVPACNFGRGIEWQAGVARARESGRGFTSAAYAQAKGLFKDIEGASPWGVGWVAGITRDPLRESRRGWQDPYVLVPASVALGDAMGAALLHANLGWTRNRAERRDTAIWGVALEVPGPAQLTWVGEAFGEGAARPFFRGGARWSVVKDAFDVDLTIVSRPGATREERYLSLGVFFQSGRFLP